jgi:hypothetical protein
MEGFTKEKILETATGVILGIVISDFLESSGIRGEFKQGVDNIVDRLQSGGEDGRATM